MSSQSIVLLIMGVSGAGKSLIGKMLAENLGFCFIDADQYHTPANKAKMSKGIPLTDGDRIPWLKKVAEFVNEWAEKGVNGVIACSALKEEYRQILLSNANHYYILYLKGNYELIASRLSSRQHEFMNPNLLQSQFETLEEPKNAIFLDAGLSPEEIVKDACFKIKEAEEFHRRGTNYGATDFQKS